MARRKLTISKVRRQMYRTSRMLGDVQAAKQGKIPRRVARRAAGKLTGRLLRKLFK